MTHINYTYSTLRYIHDLSTGEFINVGIVLHCPSIRHLGARLRHTHGRISCAFPDLDTGAFRSSMAIIEKALRLQAANYEKGDLFQEKGDAAAFGRQVVPLDDSSLQWSPVGGGLTKDPKQELERLYERLVARYDEKLDRRRSDEDVWRSVREKLDAAKLSDKLVKTVIRSSVDELPFEHAWKNGIWHCYRAISFDLADADSIKRKARQWNGHLSSVSDAPEAFKPYFVLGMPGDRNLLRAYNDAVAILEKSPVQPTVYPESEADQLVDQIESDIRSHGHA
jgi:hypothetical protein